MVYIDLTNITPPAPNDPLVDEDSQLNDNWDIINAKLDKMKLSPGILDLIANPVANGVEQGQEVVISGDLRVWNGSAYRSLDNFETAWSAWASIPLSASVASMGGFTPQYRTNSMLRQGELRGQLLKDVGAGAWTHDADVIASSTAGHVLTTSFIPVAPVSYVVGTSVPTTPSTQIASGSALVSNVSSQWRLTVTFRGNSGGGNFLSLDGVRWYY